ncbi:rhomboid family intramembrane serine protease [Roseibium sp. CAU 1637]|uniref:Rhomboid family intramembrane serine protease n=1 Tax=Roseibium limicola TaxID=2816037 RepID=A0A939J689_9HYPH|nr:rhomboid family intramembrane serine protease [Roseibium limicola]MBO0344872.1 rhomboid family intramembrane serine protease [Roseibium limicola]
MNQQPHPFPSGSEPEFGSGQPPRQPAFNLPGVIVALAGVMVVIHVVRSYFLSAEMSGQVLLYFAFWPVRYDPSLLFSGQAPGGVAADIWAFVTYGLLHGGTTHIVFNLLWMAIFGSAVARRFGTGRFLLLSVLCTAAGAATHLVTHAGESTPMIGASAAISGYMAAAIRFVFQRGGPLGAIRRQDAGAYLVPAVSLRDSFSNRQVMGFIGVWFGLNLVFGLASIPFGGGAGSIAWEAHIGGFIAGLLLFPLLDPVPSRKMLT